MIYSVPYKGESLQIELDKVDDNLVGLIQKNGGQSSVRLRDGSIIDIDNAKFDASLATMLNQNMAKDHLHPKDVDAKWGQGGFAEFIHETVNPGERRLPGQTDKDLFWNAAGRMGAEVDNRFWQLGQMTEILMAKIQPAKQQARDMENIKLGVQAREKWKANMDEQFGKPDVYSSTGKFIPDALLISLTSGMGGAIEKTLAAGGEKVIAAGAAKLAARGYGEKEIFDWSYRALTQKYTLGAAESTARSALIENIPTSVVNSTLRFIKTKPFGKAIVKEGMGGALYGAISSGGDPEAIAKDAMFFAAFAPLAAGAEAARFSMARRAGKLPAISAWMDNIKTPEAGDTIRSLYKTGYLTEEQSVGFYTLWKTGRQPGESLSDYLLRTTWEKGTYEAPPGPGPAGMGYSGGKVLEGPQPLQDWKPGPFIKDEFAQGHQPVARGHAPYTDPKQGRPGPAEWLPREGEGLAPSLPVPTTKPYTGPVAPEMPRGEGTLAGMMPSRGMEELYQGAEAGIPRGSTLLMDDGSAIVTLFENADFSTFVHEAAHIWRKTLPAKALATIEQKFGIADGVWTKEAEENFAQAFESYIGKGEAPTKNMDFMFEKYKTWMGDVYENTKGTPLEYGVDKGLQTIFENMLGGKGKRNLAVTGAEQLSQISELVGSKVLEQNGKVAEGAQRPVWAQKTDESAKVAVESAEKQVAKELEGVATPEAANGWLSSVKDSIVSGINPAGRGSQAARMGQIIRKESGELALSGVRAREATKVIDRMFDKLESPERLRFINDVEAGTKPLNPDHQAAWEILDGVLEKSRNSWQKLDNANQINFIENYFPHIWKDPKKAEAVYTGIYSKGSLEGRKGFLNKRTLPTVKDGLDRGLELVSDNPVELVLRKAYEVDRYVMGRKIFRSMDSAGYLKHGRPGGTPPEGYARIDDKIAKIYGKVLGEKATLNRIERAKRDVEKAVAKGNVEAGQLSEVVGKPFEKAEGKWAQTGEWYAPEPVAHVLNNYLGKGLQGNNIYQGVRQATNLLNQAQLGLSLFHAGFTSIDAMVSRGSLGASMMAHGAQTNNPAMVAKGVGAWLEGITPGVNLLAVWRQMSMGDKLMREALEPGAVGGVYEMMTKVLADAGGRVKMDSFYKNNSIEAFLQAFHQGKKLQTALKAFPALLEYTSRPVMEWIVPRQKLGAFMQLSLFELEKLGGKAGKASESEYLAAVQRAWDTVDNRMGQLVYDNLFWNKAAKELGMVATRSVGWNIGTLREVGGGVKDWVTMGARTAEHVFGKNKDLTFEMTPRMAYVATMPFVTGLYGGMYHYICTGEIPKHLKDWFYPKTGRKRSDGSDDRIQLPSYGKDVYAYATHPAATVGHKVSPGINIAIELMLKNEDFYGTEIRHKDDPLVKQIGQVMKHVVDSFKPFSIRNIEQTYSTGGSAGQMAANFVGLTPAPASTTRTKAQNKVSNYNADTMPRGSRTKAETERYKTINRLRTKWMNGKSVSDEVSKAVKDGVIKRRDVSERIYNKNWKSFDESLKRLTVGQLENVMKVANEEEKKSIQRAIFKKKNANN